jgi:hypothetical protein
MLYLFITGGPKLYDTLYGNLPIPHKRTIQRMLEKEENILEGELHGKQLENFLNKNGYPKKYGFPKMALK